MEKIKCKICNDEIVFKDKRGLSKFINHLKIHNISPKDYYDKYLKKPDEGICPVCGTPTKFMSILRGYLITCGTKCQMAKARSLLSEDDKRRSIENMRKTKLEKYGDPNYSNPKKAYDTKKEKYGDGYYCNTDKARQTNLEKYGVEHYNNAEKARQTCLDRYNNPHYTNREKCRKTFQEIYGTDNIFTLDTIKEKCQKTKMKKYNDPFYTNRAKNAITVKEKYNVDNVFQLTEIQEKIKKTNSDKYGVEYTFQSEEVKNKIRQTCLARYGTYSPMQNHDIRMSTQSKYSYDQRLFDSSWELGYYIWLTDHNVSFEYQPNIAFEYTIDGQVHYYHPDFLVDGKYTEIKGLQFFENNNPAGNMINPFDRTQDKLYEAKHQCMIANNINIITDCDFILDYIKETYTLDYLKLFKTNILFPYPNVDLSDKTDMGFIHHFHKSIYEAHIKNRPSPLDAWNDKELIRKVALNRLKYIGKCRPSDILQGFNVTKLAGKVSVFNPSLAKDLINKYIPYANKIIDPFSGFSGRMLGSVATGKQYIGWDINQKHVDESNEIIKYKSIGNICTVTCQDLLSLQQTDWSTDENTCLFTCPPYEDKEHWNNNEIIKSCDDWISICMEKHKDCKKYLFIVDKTEKYKDFIVDTIQNKSHFGENTEYIILI